MNPKLTNVGTDPRTSCLPLIRQKSRSLCLAHVTAMQPAEEPEADGYCGIAR